MVATAVLPQAHEPYSNLAPENFFRVYGPPGVGKTRYVARQVNVAVQSGRRVLVTSLTRAAAAEIAGRQTQLPRECVGTLHSHCYRAIGRPTIAEAHVKEWNEIGAAGGSVPKGWALISADGERADEDAPLEGRLPGETNGDELLNQMNLYRARLTPRDRWDFAVRHFASAWDSWKREAGYLDFTDLIETCLDDVEIAPGNPSALFVDEAQDMDFLEMSLLRKWGSHTDRFIIVGDGDQCQPGETQVLTPAGYVRLDTLDPKRHRLISFDRHSSTLVGFREGYAFEKASRPYTGELVTIRAADGRQTRTTHDHRCIVRWRKHADAYAVYLMQQGERWRVGWCKLFHSNGLHVGVRARLDRADAAWILATFSDKEAAAAYEKIVAARFGLPLICFEPHRGQARDQIDAVFAALDSRRQRLRAQVCLATHHRDWRQPLWSARQRNEYQGKQTPLVVRACNLLPEVMELPVVSYSERRHVDWQAFDVSREQVRDFPVYSLNVEPHHNYVADGIVTMNNLYQFRGSDPSAFLEPELPEAQTRVLGQSYRVPSAIHAYAVRWIEQMPDRTPITYHPRGLTEQLAEAGRGYTETGSRRRLDGGRWTKPEAIVDDVQRQLELGRTAMVLTSCAYMLKPLIAVLRERGIPFHNPYRRKQGAWNPLRHGTPRVLAFLKPELPALWENEIDGWLWNGKQLRLWIEVLKAAGVFPRGMKKQAMAWPDETFVTPDAIGEWFTEPAIKGVAQNDLDWFLEHALEEYKRSLGYPIEVVKQFGAERLMEEPRVVVGTIHSVKGGEADAVYVCPDLSAQAAPGWSRGEGWQYEAMIRQFYVAFTRAKEELILCDTSGPTSVTW